MKKLLGLLFCVGVGVALTLGTTGCTNPKKDTAKKDPVAPAKKTDVTVAADPAKAGVKAGDSTTPKLKLTRGADAKNEVTFDIAVEPKDKGVTASADKVKGDASEAPLKIVTTDAAVVGEYKITVTATSKDSEKATATVTLTVTKKDVAVVPPKTDMKLEAKTDAKDMKAKQGAKDLTAKVSVTMGADLKKATVKVMSTDDKAKETKAVTAKVDHDSMDKSGTATVSIVVADDAAPGDYWVVITTAGEGATPPMVDTKLKITVEKK